MRTEQNVRTDIATVDAKFDGLSMIDRDDLVDLDVTDHSIGCDILSVAGVRWSEIADLVRTALERQRADLEHELHHIQLEKLDDRTRS